MRARDDVARLERAYDANGDRLLARRLMHGAGNFAARCQRLERLLEFSDDEHRLQPFAEILDGHPVERDHQRLLGRGCNGSVVVHHLASSLSGPRPSSRLLSRTRRAGVRPAPVDDPVVGIQSCVEHHLHTDLAVVAGDGSRQNAPDGEQAGLPRGDDAGETVDAEGPEVGERRRRCCAQIVLVQLPGSRPLDRALARARKLRRILAEHVADDWDHDTVDGGDGQADVDLPALAAVVQCACKGDEQQSVSVGPGSTDSARRVSRRFCIAAASTSRETVKCGISRHDSATLVAISWRKRPSPAGAAAAAAVSQRPACHRPPPPAGGHAGSACAAPEHHRPARPPAAAGAAAALLPPASCSCASGAGAAAGISLRRGPPRSPCPPRRCLPPPPGAARACLRTG